MLNLNEKGDQVDEQLRCDTTVASVVLGTLGGLGGWLWHWQIGWLASATVGIGLGALLAFSLDSLDNIMEKKSSATSPDKD